MWVVTCPLRISRAHSRRVSPRSSLTGCGTCRAVSSGVTRVRARSLQGVQMADTTFRSTAKMADDAADMASNVADTVADAASRVSDKASAFGKKAVDQLNATTEYFRENDVNAMVSDVKSWARSNPTQALIAAAAVGFLAATLIRRR